jgi:hypothetical protein
MVARGEWRAVEDERARVERQSRRVAAFAITFGLAVMAMVAWAIYALSNM